MISQDYSTKSLETLYIGTFRGILQHHVKLLSWYCISSQIFFIHKIEFFLFCYDIVLFYLVYKMVKAICLRCRDHKMPTNRLGKKEPHFIDWKGPKLVHKYVNNI